MLIFARWEIKAGLCVLFFALSNTNLLAIHEQTKAAVDPRTQKLREDQNVGCGPGNYIMKDSTVLSLTMRATTNNSFSAQLFGVSSGTCGCRKHDVVQGAENKRQLFWALHQQDIEVELAEARIERPYFMAYQALLNDAQNKENTR